MRRGKTTAASKASLSGADASKIEIFHRKAAEAAKDFKNGGMKPENHPEQRHDHARSGMIFFATLAASALCFAVFFDGSPP